ncbi:LHFPL tetraspan subfamily member 2 protein isoform X2 [Planococcus citri]|uniref:LHFPL tetraspan subfamily member 2 protein isoform X2 n=2 Tax=Planococcus citri TaxID=170843 RepID=UPI0031FA05B1
MCDMYSFVFTLANLSWMLLSFLSLILMYFTLDNARWIVSNKAYDKSALVDPTDIPLYPSLGINSRCNLINGHQNCASFALEGLSTDPSVFPTLWKISYIFFSVGIYITFFTTIGAFSSCYFHTIYNKSIFNIIGCIQALAGLFYLNAFIFYMGGWGHRRVLGVCGINSGPFTLGDCSLGSTFYYAVLGVLVTFISACVSSIADRSVFRYKVTRRMNAGKRFIFVL